MSISHYNGAWFNVLHTHIGKLRRNFRARWETVMPREKRSLFFEMWCFLCSFLVTVECYSIMVSQKEVHVHVTQPSRIGSVGSVLRGKDENIFWIFFFLFYFVGGSSTREWFPQRDFFQSSLFHFNRQASHTCTAFVCFCCVEKSTIFRFFLYIR